VGPSSWLEGHPRCDPLAAPSASEQDSSRLGCSPLLSEVGDRPSEVIVLPGFTRRNVAVRNRASAPTQLIMNVTFHALAAIGIAHMAAIRLESSREGWFYRTDVRVLGSAITLGVLSHGVLDGLKHGYPIQTVPDVLCASVLVICWCLCVHRRFFLLFASVSLASFAPDIVDLGPRMLRFATGTWTPIFSAAPLFPWHWPDGSGSMYAMPSKVPASTRILDIGQNRIVSWTNHLIVIAFAAAGIFANPRVFRFLSTPTHL